MPINRPILLFMILIGIVVTISLMSYNVFAQRSPTAGNLSGSTTIVQPSSLVNIKNITILSMAVPTGTVMPNSNFNISGDLSGISGKASHTPTNATLQITKSPIRNAKIIIVVTPVTLTIPPIQPMKVNSQTDSMGHFALNVKSPTQTGVVFVSAIFEGDSENYGSASIPSAIIIK